ncbi:HtaA domain-containing protein [Streptomyces sp. NPDC059459]|uniref:HtaA domain-containing protein n=1 Tax=Streptomyces sp. NPDC059459 TaxID=3346839 RepID=UPI0036CB560D
MPWSADLTARDDVITVDGVAATLTGAGAKVFGDYPAGTALDSVDLSVTLSEDAQLPDGGGTGTSGGTGWARVRPAAPAVRPPPAAPPSAAPAPPSAARARPRAA